MNFFSSGIFQNTVHIRPHVHVKCMNIIFTGNLREPYKWISQVRIQPARPIVGTPVIYNIDLNLPVLSALP
jgi:hypothetical protein